MEQEKINEIRAREQAAAPSPWQYDGMHNEIQTPKSDDSFVLIVSELREHPNEKILDDFGHTYNPDFDFIANSRQDIPALLDYITALQAENAELKARLDNAVELPCKVGDTVYEIGFTEPHEWEVTEIDIHENTAVFRLGNKGTDNYAAFHISELGVRYFLTHEEAETALSQTERQGEYERKN